MEADSLKSALETDHGLKAEHINPIKSCLIRDNLHMRAHLCSNGHLLTPALKEISQTRAHVLQWHAKNGHKNILFMDENIFTIKKQYNNQNNKIYAQTSLEVCSDGATRPSPFLRHGLMGVPSGVTHIFIFARNGRNWCLSVSRGRATRSCETS